MENPATSLFRQYLRIKSVQPKPDYVGCVEFLKVQAQRLGLPYNIVEMAEGKPIFVMTWVGSEPALPSLLLNSHTDVVPVFMDFWKHDPFAAVKEPNGDIYGRGTQDMKSVGIQHIEAVHRLKVEQKKTLKRTVHLSFMPDEEIGSHDGMEKYVVSEQFKKLNVGIALDEGLASPGETLNVFYGERNVFWIKFHCQGQPGHGSRFIENTAAEKVQYLTNKLLAYREEQKLKFDANPERGLGEFSTVNLTYMSGGLESNLNVVPNKFAVGFDIRIAPSTDLEMFEAQLKKWCEEAGGSIDIECLQKFTDRTLTSIADSDEWYGAFKRGCTNSGLKVEPQIFSGGTDSRYLRQVGLPALGFSPMNHTPVLLHDHNEFLNEKVFLKGIDIFCNIIEEMANV